MTRRKAPPSKVYIFLIFFGLASAIEPLCRRRYMLAPEMEALMWDLAFLTLGLAFFAAAIAYTLLCERL